MNSSSVESTALPGPSGGDAPEDEEALADPGIGGSGGSALPLFFDSEIAAATDVSLKG